MSHPLLRDAWRTAGVSITLLLLLIFFMYQQTVAYLTGKWNELEAGEYGHGYLVLLISLYLVFCNRQKLKALMPCPEYRAILAVLIASVLWVSAALVNIETMQTIGLFLLMASVLWALLGNRVMLALAFPVFYISFAIPAWFPLSPILQEFTADVVFWIIRILEVPALRIENMIVLPAGRLSIEEACSGLRYLLAALTLGTFFAYLNYTTFSARLIVVLISAGAAVLANIIRVFVVVYLGYATDMQHPLISDHLMFGWYLFGGVLVVLLVIDAMLHRAFSHGSNEVSDTEVDQQAVCNKMTSKYIAVTLACAAIVSAGPAMIFWEKDHQQVASSPLQVKQLLNTDLWSVINEDENNWKPQYHGAINHSVILQGKDFQKVNLYLGMYPVQTQGKELIYYLNKISDNKVWHTLDMRAKHYDAGNLQVLEETLQKQDGARLLVWYWYHVAGQNTVNKYHAKALQLLGFINGKRQASVVAIATNLDDEPEHARQILSQFVAEMELSLSKLVDDE